MENRYDKMVYRRCGRSGLRLPALTLGTWHNFGEDRSYESCRDLLCAAFDNGITQFDCANNYGPPAGAAEEMLGRVLGRELKSHRDELIVTTKAGYYMWPGPYGEWGSRKNLLASLDQSLRRMNLDYVDIYYHHRPDPDTPLEESMQALADAVHAGKALYVGISNYSAEDTARAADLLRGMGVPLLISQARYSMFNRLFEQKEQAVLLEKQVGAIAFCPLAEGLLTNKYFHGVPEDSRAAGKSVFLSRETAQGMYVEVAKKLDAIAGARGQSLAQMALAWALHNPAMTSLSIGASRVSQLMDNLRALDRLDFSAEELAAIDKILLNVPPFY